MLHVAANLVEELLGRGRIDIDEPASELQVDGHAHQLLLRTVVQLAFEVAAVGIGGPGDPCS